MAAQHIPVDHGGVTTSAVTFPLNNTRADSTHMDSYYPANVHQEIEQLS